MAIKWPARRGETADVTSLTDLSDVSTAALTNRFVLVADGSSYLGRLLVEADISNLQAYLTSFTETNDLSAAVTWANIPIANVPTGTTSSTVSLGDHLHDGILDANLLDKTAFEIVTGRWDFESDGSEPQLCIVDSDSNGAATRAFIEFLGKGDVLTGRMGYLTAASGIFTIDNALPNAGVELTSAGVQKLRVDIDGTTITGTAFIENTSGEKLVLRDTNSTGNAVLNFIAFNDMNDLRQGFIGFGSSSNDNLSINNALGDILLVATNTSVTGALTATSYDGVLAANLLDKAAAVETITGLWNFAGTLRVTGGTTFRIQNSTDTDFVSMNHNGTDFVWGFTNTLDWDITGLSSIQAGTVDADFKNITATSFNGTTSFLDAATAEVISGVWNFTGGLTALSYDGVLAANLLDKAAAETISGAWTHSATIASTTTGAAPTTAALNISAASPFIRWDETDQATDEKVWFAGCSGSSWVLATAVDGGGGIASAPVIIARTGTAIDTITFAATSIVASGALTATSYGGIAEANLLDKTANESISGTYTFTAANSIILPLVNDAVTPTLAFGTGGDGFYLQAASVINAATGGVARFQFSGGGFQSIAAGGPTLVNETASGTNPVFTIKGDADTGVGSGGLDQLDLIAGALSCLAVRETAGARQIGFYTTAPVAKPTGVAVTAAGVHAALVTLGLIAA